MGRMRGGRSSGAWLHFGIVLGVLSLSMTFSLAGAAQYSVGSDAGWVLSVNYTEWASKRTFHEGDTIVFLYQRGQHDVLRVSPEDYDACKVSNPMETDASGHTTFVLRAEPYYFICGFPSHCDKFSQKVSFNVEPASAGSNDNSPFTQTAQTPIAFTPIAYGPTGAFAPGAAPAMSRPSMLYSLILLAFGCLLGSCGSIRSMNIHMLP